MASRPSEELTRRPRGTVNWLELSGLAAGLAGVLALGFAVSIWAAGVIFVVGFGVLATVRPRLALLFILGSAPFVWDVGGGTVNMAISEIALILTLAAFLATGRLQLTRNPLWLPIGAYFLICTISLAVGGFLDGSAATMIQMGVYMGGTVWLFSGGVRSSADVLPALYAFVVGSLILSAMLFIAGSNYAFGIHKNNAGSSLGLGFLAAVGLWMGETSGPRRRALALAGVGILAGLIFSLSRGAWMGALSGVLVIQLLRRQWGMAVRMVGLFAPVAIVAWTLLPAESKEYVTAVGSESHNTKARFQSIDFALMQFRSAPILGVGPGLRKMFDATNIVMTALAETGVLGLATFGAIFVVFGSMCARVARRTSADDPCMVLLTIGAALMTDKLVHGMVDHYWVRGILPVWAGAGLAVFAANQARIRRSAGRN